MLWEQVNTAVLNTADSLKVLAEPIFKIARTVPYTDVPGSGVYVNAYTRQAWLNPGDMHSVAANKYMHKLSEVTDVVVRYYEPPGYMEDIDWIKVAYSPALRAITDTMNITPGKMFGLIPNHPHPITSMLTSGAMGAGLGYGLGYLGEKLLPDKWEKGRLRKSLAVMGGLAGAMPGLGVGVANLTAGKPFNDDSMFNYPAPPPYGKGVKLDMVNDQQVHQMLNPSLTSGPIFDKYSYEQNSSDPYGAMGAMVPVNAFNQVIWNDPYVSNQLPPNIQTAASGLVTGAAYDNGRQAKLISPADVGRIAAGMGSGYLAGTLVGKGLGILMGMPQETQDELKRTGAWAGIVANLVPLAFGGR